MKKRDFEEVQLYFIYKIKPTLNTNNPIDIRCQYLKNIFIGIIFQKTNTSSIKKVVKNVR